DFQIRVTFLQRRAETFGGVTFTIVLLCTVLVENRLNVQREDFLLLRMNHYCGQSSVVIGHLTVTVLAGGTVRAMNFRRAKMFHSMLRDDYPFLPILIFVDDTGLG